MVLILKGTTNPSNYRLISLLEILKHLVKRFRISTEMYSFILYSAGLRRRTAASGPESTAGADHNCCEARKKYRYDGCLYLLIVKFDF